MNKISLFHPTGKVQGHIVLPGSKSESNRLLLLKHLYFPHLRLHGLSDSSDTEVFLKAVGEAGDSIYTADAGTTTRFLCAYYASLEGRNISLSGSARMLERPIGILVEALRELGADIEYRGKEGYLPLFIRGRKLKGGVLSLNSTMSSQYISALMMLGPKLPGGLQLQLKGMTTSASYIYLTAGTMQRLGFKVDISGSHIFLHPEIPDPPENYHIEPDWSAASYWYSMVALSGSAEVYLRGLREDSLQGDAILRSIFRPLGVESVFLGAGYRLTKAAESVFPPVLDLISNPDLAQTLAVVLAVKDINAELKGLHTLKIKETDRLQAMQQELLKVGAKINITDHSMQIGSGFKPDHSPLFQSWEDHRMAMSLAPLALRGPIKIAGPEVVNKSYPNFWRDLQSVGFNIEEIA